MKINRTILKVAILAVAMQNSGMGATTPALGAMIAAFPTVAPSLVMMVATIPALLLAIIPPIYAKATEFMKKKSILYIAAVLFVVGGVGPAFFHTNIYVILGFRVLFGIANGIVIPMTTDLVVDFFEDQERNDMMGYVSSITGVSGVVFQMLGGYLAGINWFYSFYSYLLGAIFFLFAVINLPEPEKKQKLASEGSIVNLKVPGSVYAVSAVFGFFFLFMYIVITNAAVVIMGEKLGTPTEIGLAFSFLTLTSFVTSTAFGQLFKRLKYSILPISYIFGAIGLYLCYVGVTFWTFTLGIGVFGLGLGMVVPAVMTKLTGLVPFELATKVIGVGFLGMGVGGFIQPMVFAVILDMVHQGPGRFPFIIGAIGMLVFAVVIYFVDKATPIIPNNPVQA